MIPLLLVLLLRLLLLHLSPLKLPLLSPLLFNSNSDMTPDQSSNSRKLYISHFLSTWNMRLFEFGAVLFLASIFPHTLLPLSLYALVRALAAVLLSPLLGHYIDRSNRLVSIRFSILGQRSAVILSCILFWAMLSAQKTTGGLLGALLLTLLSILACAERLCAIANTVAVERDWVVVISDSDEEYLQDMNAQMRRIDLFCKLTGPLIIALIVGFSPKIAILTTMGLNMTSMMAEYGLIARIYHSVPALQEHGQEHETTNEDSTTSASIQGGLYAEARARCTSTNADLRSYVTSPAFLPSISLSLLYLTVLSFSGQMTTYLLTFPALTPIIVGGIRTVATIFELSSTWLAPSLISHIGPTRAGIWCLSFQIICLAGGVSTFFYPTSGAMAGVYLFIASIILSRIGLYAFDLVAQLIIQSTIPPTQRATFSTTEASLQNFFELLTSLTTIIFSRPSQFKIPACISFVSVCIAGALYSKYVRDRRGHLLHLPCGNWGKGHWNGGREDVIVDRTSAGHCYEPVPAEEG